MSVVYVCKLLLIKFNLWNILDNMLKRLYNTWKPDDIKYVKLKNGNDKIEFNKVY